ncbi:MAG: hypothetical protein J7L15_04035 [Clostridiales bacterium]|nr:hypothetical protein [Clostridiales bacterium]
MGYSNRQDIEDVLNQALTSATASTPDGFNSVSNLLNIGNVLDNNLLPSDTINSYISISDSQIDGTLSELYKTPLSERTDLEMVLYSDITEYNEYLVFEHTHPLNPGDIVVIKQLENEERHVIFEAISTSMYSVVDVVQYGFTSGSRVLRVKYPPPIRWISARLSAASVYDKYFSAQVSPGMSEYGKELRQIANNDLNNILNGTTILHGQHRIGRRFYNPNLKDQYGLPMGGATGNDTRQTK